MKRFAALDAGLLVALLLLIGAVCPQGTPAADRAATEAVKIVAPDGLQTRIYRQPNPGSELLSIALHNQVFQVVGAQGNFVEVLVPEHNVTGFVLREHTTTWTEPEESRGTPIWPFAAGAGLIALMICVYLAMRSKKSKELERRARLITQSIREAEDRFRAADYAGAIQEFVRHIDLQGGDVRNPDVYRRLTVCYRKVHETDRAAQSWEKMRSLGGVKTPEDYKLGLEIMTEQGKHAEAAQIYEQLLELETESDKRHEILKNLFDIYLRIKDSRKLVKHGLALITGWGGYPQIVHDIVDYLIERRETGLAIETNNKEVITSICEEFLEQKRMNQEAEQIYLKALEYDRTDPRIHRILAETYKANGDFVKAVTELTMLTRIDKDSAEEYIDQAAKLYVQHDRVGDALAEGNPKIIKKIAQMFLSESKVHPDAVLIYERILELQPKAVGVNKMLATVYLTRGDAERYMEKLRLLQEIDGASHDYFADLARCIVDNGLVEQTLLEGNQDLNIRIIKELVKKQAHDDKTIAIFEGMIQGDSSNFLIRAALAKAYGLRGEHAKELEHFLFLSRVRPEDKDLAEKITRCAIDNDLLETLADKGEGRAVLMTGLEMVNSNADSPAALRILKKALKSYPREEKIKNYLDSVGKGASAPAAVEKSVQRQAPVPGPPVQAAAKPSAIAAERPTRAAQQQAAEAAKAPVKGLEKAAPPKDAAAPAPQKASGATSKRKAEASAAAPRSAVDSALRIPIDDKPAGRAVEEASKVKVSTVPTEARPAGRDKPAVEFVEIDLDSEVNRPEPPRAVAAARPDKKAPTKITAKPPENVESPLEVPTAPKEKTKSAGPPAAPVHSAPEAAPPEFIEISVPDGAAAEEEDAETLVWSETREQPVVKAAGTQEVRVSVKPSPAPAQGTTFVSAFEKEAEAPQPRQEQIVDVTPAKAAGRPEEMVTTFVTAHAKGAPRIQYRENELYRPHAGGLAYTAMKVIARDGWGLWQAAKEINTARDVLLRVFEKGLMKAVVLEAEAMQEFLQEVSQIGLNMAHDSILEVEEVVVGPGNSSGLVYSYFPKTLDRMIESQDRGSLKPALRLIRKIVNGLAYAANYRRLDGTARKDFLLHLQPSMVLVSEDFSDCRIAGFGYTQAFRRLTRSKQPRAHDAGINPAFAPPEFFRPDAGRLDEKAADVYSLGVLMYAMVTSEYPFEGPTIDDYRLQHTKIPPAPPRLVNQSVPDWLEHIILGCLEKNPELRWKSAAEIQQALSQEMK